MSYFSDSKQKKSLYEQMREATSGILGKSKEGWNQNGISFNENGSSISLPKDPNRGLRLAEQYVKKFYLDELYKYEVSNIPRSIQEFKVGQNICLFRVNNITFNKNENILNKLNNVYSSLHSLGLSIVFFIHSDGNRVSLYLGTKSQKIDFEENQEMGKVFEKAFSGNFPGSQISSVEYDQCEKLLLNIFPEDGHNAVTALTSLPALKDDDSQNIQYVQGIEKFIDTMKNEEYSVLIISDPISGGQIEEVKHGYEELHTELTPLLGYDLTIGKNDARTMTTSEMDGYTDSIGRSVAKTQSFSRGTSITKSESTTNTFGVNIGVFGSNGTSVSDSKQKNCISATIMSIFGGVAKAAMTATTSATGINAGINASKAKTNGIAEGEQKNEQIGNQDSEQESHTNSYQKGMQDGYTEGTTSSIMMKYENKSIKELLSLIDAHLKRLEVCENYGMWSSSAYFISPSKETSIIAASAYKGIINGEGTALETPSINTWFKDENVKKINKYLSCFSHPRFHDKDYLINTDAVADITATTMISTKELSIQCNVPYKSVAGIAVREMAEFGRNIYQDEENKSKKIKIGDIYYMGVKEKNAPVELDVERLKEHTFITGSTGSGKSNTVYEIISRLNNMSTDPYKNVKYLENKIPTLIIEPAKGEYKNVFGEKFHVFGTNTEYTDLLKINPFQFDEGIHVLEHIDRLIDIFNVCWPMYAAMPAVLKEAVEQAYISAGWNLRTSQNKNGINIFPCFEDLLVSLKKVIVHSDYSQEVKDNYTGALITRVKSFTNGFFKEMFCACEDEEFNKQLYEESTIVDLSRVGSSETKAMIMGIIVMKLQERRMSHGGINLPLSHVTILEEAHNLLRRTSMEQTSEGSNLQGKSVEMISNAIAEMRTYGEGFIIVDQAPGLLDMSAIRNTNTKIILHLPDMTDRELVGRAAGLSDDQLVELAKLPSGVAAIYQNKWVEPVLCQVDYYDVKPVEYVYNRKKKNNSCDESYVRTKISTYLISMLSGCDNKVDVEKLKEWLIGSRIESATKIEILRIFDSPKSIKKERVERVIADLVDSTHSAFEVTKHADSVEEWNTELIRNMDIDVSIVSEIDLNNILECVIHHRSLERVSDEENFLKWMNYMGRRGL